ncbi:uncharacterized protein LOC118933425 [Manis pentadactyla]|uniref:uncharacterized protein LOC118933425 n=1 Tax=Manis pentadactyla TaxID=143292 RepID=UPI00255C77FE|nr:uncharacterized protein LOC118933425 [Manis pentadactyla]
MYAFSTPEQALLRVSDALGPWEVRAGVGGAGRAAGGARPLLVVPPSTVAVAEEAKAKASAGSPWLGKSRQRSEGGKQVHTAREHFRGRTSPLNATTSEAAVPGPPPLSPCGSWTGDPGPPCCWWSWPYSGCFTAVRGFCFPEGFWDIWEHYCPCSAWGPPFLSLRALVTGPLSAPPVRAASAPWSWLLVGYGAAGLSCAVWAVLSPQERDQGQENSKALMWRLPKLSRPDLPFLSAAFFFLIVAVLGETFIPYYSGRVTDILGGDFDPSAFGSAIFFMCFFSVGSSLSAGCRGSCFLITMSRINLRIQEQLFSSLLHEDLGFLQETKTGSASGDPGRSGESRAGDAGGSWRAADCAWLWGPGARSVAIKRLLKNTGSCAGVETWNMPFTCPFRGC